MRKTVLLAISIVAMILASCEKTNVEPNDPVITKEDLWGEWRLSAITEVDDLGFKKEYRDTLPYRFTFRFGNVFTSTTGDYIIGSIDSEPAKYDIKDRFITIYGSVTIEYEVISVSDDLLVLEYKDGDYTFVYYFERSAK